MLYSQRKTYFFLVGQTFLLSFRWFNYLAEILLVFGRNKLCPLFVNFAIGHNTFLPLAYNRRKEAGSSLSKEFRQIYFLPHFCVSVILPRYGFQQDNFSDFSFSMFFLLLEVVVKAALFVVWEVGAIQVVINPSLVYLRHLRLAWQSRKKSTRLPVRASSKGRLRTFPLPSFSSIGGFYMSASLRFLLSDCMVCNQIFYFFIRICLFSVLPPFGCGLHRIASVGRPRSGAKVIPGCYAAARSEPPVLEKISTPTLHCVLLRVVFSLKNLAFAHPYLC